MKLRFGIPFSIALLVASSLLSGAAGFNTYYLIIGVSAVWIAWDSARIELRKFQTQLALPPLAVAAAVSVAWPIVFPAYLRTRQRIRNGLIQAGPPDRSIPVWVYVGGMVVVGLSVAGYVMLSGVRRDLMPIVTALTEEFNVDVRVTLQGRSNMVVVVPATAYPNGLEEATARRMAQVAFATYRRSPELLSVQVVALTVERRGALTITKPLAAYSWNWRTLRDSTVE